MTQWFKTSFEDPGYYVTKAQMEEIESVSQSMAEYCHRYKSVQDEMHYHIDRMLDLLVDIKMSQKVERS